VGEGKGNMEIEDMGIAKNSNMKIEKMAMYPR
jgi:hypothetical protein